ncbi:MAG: MFS transporter [bacterium]|nr:MFS transporter [bacterium]
MTAELAKSPPSQDSFLSKFTVLKGALRELWVMFGTKVLSIVAYGLVNSTLILWLSKDMQFGDISAGVVVTFWSTVLTLITVMIGSLVDTIGIKKSLIIGFVFCIIARGVMSFFTNPWLVVPTGLLPLAIGEAMMTPVIVAGIKKYATVAQRSMAFSLFYAMMNVGFAISGTCFDKVRTTLGEYGSYTLPFGNVTLSTYQTLIFLGFLCTIPNLLLVCFGIREGIAINENDEIVHEKRDNKYAGQPMAKAILLSCQDCLKQWVATFGSLWKQPAFYRFLMFLSIVVCVRLIFYHFHYTFPKYGIRELGEGAPIGRLFGVLNPVLIIFLGPIIGALTQKYSAYKVVIIGSFIAALSVFFMAVPPVWYNSLAHGPLGNFICNTWLGQNTPIDQINPLFVGIFFAVILLSIGEAFYSPRLYEYPAAIAPKGQEGSYMSLSLLPYFIAKFFVGLLSGWLLTTFCPAEGPRNSEMMWLIIGGMAMLTPIGLLVFKKKIQVKEAGRDD